jgi:cobalt-zinc-cadmium efflux system protein
VAHEHAHGHGHSHQHHGPAADADRRWLAVALGIIATFMVVELVAGILADSLALLSDAAHMLTDAGAIAIALYAAGLAARPAAGRFTFGLGRAEILSAQANGATLLVLAGVIAVEAIRRLWAVPDVDGALVLVVGLLGACANVGAAAALGKAERRSLNVEGARAHVLTDLFASLAAATAGAVVLLTGFDRADAIASLMVAGGHAALGLASPARRRPRAARGRARGRRPAGRRPGAGLLSGRGRGPRPARLGGHLGLPGAGAHVLVKPGDDCHGVRRSLQAMVGERFGIEHVTLQVDHAPAHDRLLEIEPRR